MGIRSRNYIAIPSGQDVDLNADWIGRLLAEKVQDVRGTLLVFDTNFAPLWNRFTPSGVQLMDLDTEREMLAWLGAIPGGQFRLARVGDQTETAGSWDAASFHDHPVVQSIEQDILAALGTGYSVLPGPKYREEISMFGEDVTDLRTQIPGHVQGEEGYLRESLCAIDRSLATLLDRPDDAELINAIRQQANRAKFALSEFLRSRPAPAPGTPEAVWLERVCGPVSAAAGALFLAPMSCLSDVQEELALLDECLTTQQCTTRISAAQKLCARAEQILTAWLGPAAGSGAPGATVR